jgi:uncharacterized protein (TIGR03067 family)
MARRFWLLQAVVLLIGQEDDQAAAAKERARFEGVWRFALVEVEGTRQPEAPFATNKIIIRGDGSYVVIQGQRITRGQFQVDPTKTPRHFDGMITDGPAKGQTFSAIYELSGDTYKFCASLRSKDRPSAFISERGNGMMLQVLKREKQTVKEALNELGRQELTGIWQAVSSVLDGKKASDDDTIQTKLSFDAHGGASLLREGKDATAATTKIDAAVNALAIDITWKKGKTEVGETSLGIYKIEDKRLTICLGAPGARRPKEFLSERGSGNRLTTYERAKANEPRKNR